MHLSAYAKLPFVRLFVFIREDMMISPDLSQDPTLGRVPDWRCPACGNLGCVFFQLPERVAEDAMTLVYVCTKSGCGYSVKQDASQEADADAGEEGSQHTSLHIS